MSDNVNAPSHYALEGLDVEAIDVIRSVLGEEKFKGYCRGNAIKYIIRADRKNGTEDLRKAIKYLTWECGDETQTDEEETYGEWMKVWSPLFSQTAFMCSECLNLSYKEYDACPYCGVVMKRRKECTEY